MIVLLVCRFEWRNSLTTRIERGADPNRKLELITQFGPKLPATTEAKGTLINWATELVVVVVVDWRSSVRFSFSLSAHQEMTASRLLGWQSISWRVELKRTIHRLSAQLPSTIP